MRLLFTLLAVTFFTAAFAQNGAITGTVTDEKSTETIIGATVVVLNGNAGSVTDVDGNYQISVAPGTYTVQIKYVGYATKEISDVVVRAGKATTLNSTLGEGSKTALEEVVVRSTIKKENINSMVLFQKNTNTVAQVVSADIIRRSPDRNTGDVLKRVSGASVQEGKYLVVRGLADRYNAAMLNGALLTSTEPDRKTFSFDLFPAAIIDNLVINKAALPELPGEFAGGLVQVNTRDIPTSNFFNLQLGTGVNVQSYGKRFYSNNVGGTDFLGIDDGTRALNTIYPKTKGEYDATPISSKVGIARALNNNWKIDEGRTPMNANLQASAGYVTKLGKGDFGLVGALSYTKNNRIVEADRFDYSLDNATVYEFHDKKYNQDIAWGGMANLAYSIGKSKISFKNLYNVNAGNYTTIRQGVDYTGPVNIRSYELSFITNNILSSQLSGDHVLKGLGGMKLHWNGSYTRVGQHVPDLRRLTYQADPGSENYVAGIPQGSGSLTNAGRFYSKLADNVYGGALDLSKSIRMGETQQTIKAGYLYQHKSRDFTPRALGYIADRSNPAINGILTQGVGDIFAPQNIGENLIRIDETTNPNDKYQAGSKLNAAYVQLDNQFLKKFSLSWGVRVENYQQEITFNTGLKDKTSDTTVTDFLPSANLKYALNDKTNIRISGSQTVIRPEFRELAEFRFYNFDLLATEGGNPNIQRTKVTNADVRYELYPAAGQFITVGGFYKFFKNPIEKFYNTTGAGSQSLVYDNTPSATSYGAEVEFRQSLGFLKKGANEESILPNTFLFANVALISNSVTFRQGSTLKDRPMQGQSGYVINGGVMSECKKTGTIVSALVNRVGRRIFIVGNNTDQPNIWEAPRWLLDLSVAQRFAKNGEVKLSVTDLLNQYTNFYEDLDENGRYQPNGQDVLRIRQRVGTNLSLSVSYRF